MAVENVVAKPSLKALADQASKYIFHSFLFISKI